MSWPGGISFVLNGLLKSSIYYFFIVNSIYLIVLLTALGSIYRQDKRRRMVNHVRGQFPKFAPGITVIAPAFNEEATIVESTKSLLMLDYPRFEVIVVNDGSRDGTLARLTEAFELTGGGVARDVRIFSSALHRHLTVIDKPNGGKADALNAGIHFAKHDIFCSVDSDSLLEPDALVKAARPFFQDPDRTVASGGTVRIANGTTVRHGRVERVSLPGKLLPLIQIVEYTRAFLCARVGWNAINSTMIVSGAFGLFSRKAVLEIGGYTKGSLGEDMELIIRLHRHFRERGVPYSIQFIPDPVCWTEAPETLEVLQRQRHRWQRGLVDSLLRHSNMFLNPRYGLVGLAGFPYFTLVEMLGPCLEIASIAALVGLAAMGRLDLDLLRLYVLASVLQGSLMTILALSIEEIYYQRYPKLRHFLTLILVSFAEGLGYRQLNAWWRLRGLIDYFRGKNDWGHMRRAGFSRPGAETAPVRSPRRGVPL